ncbi:hypothetical protein JOF53_002603 [Crossiella equi]|uniref:Uncharacterized protein n=1 Tax=Crossiella equi TaxID=130796 RepID=A0ABS5AAX2_9PSEU|nr:hypothetical protein [Crossiella equi]MBP2473731.1 hypothetical protein [Crossiella equi]
MGIRGSNSVVGGLAVVLVAAAVLAIPVWLFTGLFDTASAEENAAADAAKKANTLGESLHRQRLAAASEHTRAAQSQKGVEVLRTEGVSRDLGGVSLLVRVTGEGWRTNWMVGDRRVGPPESTAVRCYTIALNKPGQPLTSPAACP